MAVPSEPSALHILHRASGSATYVSPTSSPSALPLIITCGLNFPVEVPRRSDELPTLLLIDVNVRPASGVGQVRERHVEEVVKKTLGAIILREDWPRMACQVGLQVVSGEEEGSDGSYLALLAACVNAAVMGCMDAGVPMRTVTEAVLVGLRDQNLVMHPAMKERAKCQSLHLFAFDRNGQCLLMESEGRCGIEEWEKAATAAQHLVLAGERTGQDEELAMAGDERGVKDQGMSTRLRESVEARVARDERWVEG